MASAVVGRAEDFRVAIVHTEWNESIIASLLQGAKTELLASGVQAENISVFTVSQRGDVDWSGRQRPRIATHPLQLPVLQVPGAYELPMGAQLAIGHAGRMRRPFDAVICLGCLIKGDTMHFEYIADAVSQGIMRVGLDTGVPVIFGVLTVLTLEQALVRAGLGKDGAPETGHHNHGIEWAQTALKLAAMRRELGSGPAA